MPSNIPAKTAGVKKPSNAKNVSRTSTAEANKPFASQPETTKPLEPTKSNQAAGRSSPQNVPAGQASSLSYFPQETPGDTHGYRGVNKKKQKRRNKEAAKKAAEQPPMTGSQFADSAYQVTVKERAASQTRSRSNGYDFGGSDYDDPEQFEPDEGEDASWEYGDRYAPPQTNGHAVHDYSLVGLPGSKSKKKKKTKSSSASQATYSAADPLPSSNLRPFQPPPPPPPPALGQPLAGTHQSTRHVSKDRIWNTSTAEERERIKEFWLSLGEEDRRSLVKVEKEAVLKKMKEQQKHSCSCTVCGRKRTAIEEELEVLYDAYYEELEQYANDQHINLEDGTPIIAPPQIYAHPITRISPSRHPQPPNGRSSRSRIQEIGEDDEIAEEDDYSDEEEDDEISEDEAVEAPVGPAADFFNFGNNITVQGGILTVADDLLKNDGKKFIEMMEQLAERRMQREEEAQYAAAGMSHPSMQGHNHGLPVDDDGYDDDEDDEYDSQEDEEFDEEDDMETMTEEQRMKEGRRMFQIFAARMFEQRVLTAYREKVALERQQKLIEELDDESRVDAQREAKRAKEAQRKKDKKRQQKQAKDEEKAKREAEKAAEEAAAKALEREKAEELRQRKEEQRKKKEAEKKAQDEEKQRREAEKQRRLQEAKEQQAEQERKQREQKEREKKKREELKRREREEREAREREVKEKKDREAAEKREREARAKNESEASEAKEQSKKGELAAKQFVQTALKRPSPANPLPVAGSVPAGLHPPLTTSSHASPRLQIATPVIPKAPTPGRQRQPSFRESRNNSPKVSQPAPLSSTTSPSVQHGAPNLPGKMVTQPNLTQQSQPSSRYSPVGAMSGQVTQPPGLPNTPSMGGNTFPTTFGPPLSPMAQQVPPNSAAFSNQAAAHNNQIRSFMPGMPFPPGINGSRQMPQGRAGNMDPPIPQVSAGSFPGVGPNDLNRYNMPRDNLPAHSHSRNTSASFERSAFETPGIPAQVQPIARPAPIKRPSSVAPHQQSQSIAPTNAAEIDDLSNHLGSSALVGDDDGPDTNMTESRRGSMAPRSARQGFGNNSGFSDSLPRGAPGANGGTWLAQHLSFGAPPMSGQPTWSNAPGFGRPSNSNAFGSIGSAGRHQDVTIRLLIRTACEKLKARSPNSQNAGWHHVEDVLREVQQMNPAQEKPVHMGQMLEVCDREGNSQNGGGSFAHYQDHSGIHLIRFEPGRNLSMSGRIGDIGSPIVGGAMPAIGAQRPFQQPGGF